MRKTISLAGVLGATTGLLLSGVPAIADTADNDGVNIGNDNNASLVPVQLCGNNVAVIGVVLPVLSPNISNCANAPVIDHPSQQQTPAPSREEPAPQPPAPESPAAEKPSAVKPGVVKPGNPGGAESGADQQIDTSQGAEQKPPHKPGEQKPPHKPVGEKPLPPKPAPQQPAPQQPAEELPAAPSPVSVPGHAAVTG